MTDIVDPKQERVAEQPEVGRRPWVRPHVETRDVIETAKVPKFGHGTDASNSLS